MKLTTYRSHAQSLWNTLRHERRVSDDRRPRPRRRDDGVWEEHVRARSQQGLVCP